MSDSPTVSVHALVASRLNPADLCWPLPDFTPLSHAELKDIAKALHTKSNGSKKDIIGRLHADAVAAAAMRAFGTLAGTTKQIQTRLEAHYAALAPAPAPAPRPAAPIAGVEPQPMETSDSGESTAAAAQSNLSSSGSSGAPATPAAAAAATAAPVATSLPPFPSPPISAMSRGYLQSALKLAGVNANGTTEQLRARLEAHRAPKPAEGAEEPQPMKTSDSIEPIAAAAPSKSSSFSSSASVQLTFEVRGNDLTRLTFDREGKVQTIMFRDLAGDEARRLGLVGFIAPTGAATVAGEAFGLPELIDQFQHWLRHPDTTPFTITDGKFDVKEAPSIDHRAPRKYITFNVLNVHPAHQTDASSRTTEAPSDSAATPPASATPVSAAAPRTSKRKAAELEKKASADAAAAAAARPGTSHGSATKRAKKSKEDAEPAAEEKKEDADDDDDDNNSRASCARSPAAPSSPSKAKRGGVDTRPKCRYWTACFRKNPVHLQQFRHPADGNDDGDSNNDDDDDAASVTSSVASVASVASARSPKPSPKPSPRSPKSDTPRKKTDSPRASPARRSSSGAKEEKSDDDDDEDDAKSTASKPSRSKPSGDGGGGDLNLSGKRFVIMGAFDAGKFQVQSQIRSFGGVIVSTVGPNIDFVVCGVPTVTNDYGNVSGPGSKKHKEAVKLGLKILDEAQFRKLVADATAAGASVSASAAIAEQWTDICTMLACPMAAPVPQATIDTLEAELRIALPEDLKQLWRVSNGVRQAVTVGHPHPSLPPSAIDLFPTIDAMRRAWSTDYHTFGCWTRDFYTVAHLVPYAPIDVEGQSGWACVDHRTSALIRFALSISGKAHHEFLADSFTAVIETYHRLVKAKYERQGKRAGPSCAVTSAELLAALNADHLRSGPPAARKVRDTQIAVMHKFLKKAIKSGEHA